jgi:hypothetical protein
MKLTDKDIAVLRLFELVAWRTPLWVGCTLYQARRLVKQGYLEEAELQRFRMTHSGYMLAGR